MATPVCDDIPELNQGWMKRKCDMIVTMRQLEEHCKYLQIGVRCMWSMMELVYNYKWWALTLIIIIFNKVCPMVGSVLAAWGAGLCGYICISLRSHFQELNCRHTDLHPFLVGDLGSGWHEIMLDVAESCVREGSGDLLPTFDDLVVEGRDLSTFLPGLNSDCTCSP